MVAIIFSTYIDADNVAFVKHPIPGNPVHKFIVHRCTDAATETIITFKRWNCIMFTYKRLGNCIQLSGCNARCNMLLQLLVSQGNNTPGFTHDFNFTRCFADDH
ncbi:Uncharacterised protein [Mycobacteroides abscessus subsp. abscessus]|nr:Uncharacterised protein [Mycobacteroides abscessus subsp. abscessus]